ncbi:dihydroorotate dehydrogenase-like protein [Anaerolineae bacterium CFX9]|nr:dihydroorotate dehydrogenase-like protein [Oscillatoria laete-virens]MDL1900590.1 dihydroorotate dehydrogenase-like protein [Anaerolineae bacterium CFX9]MDL5055441.1 dihydroorotate dehydrogenase-like protein [Oscillatoria laete-virens NRMC-F 0139]
MDLTTTYMGYKLRSPLVASASPLSETVEGIQRLEDAGAGAVVLFSLFEEQLRLEQLALHHHLTYGTESHPEALSYFPEPHAYKATSTTYLELIRKAKNRVSLPIIASLNGTTPGSWVKYARQIEDAGADALELNLYSIPTDPNVTGAEVEQNDIEVVAAVRSSINIPVAVKLSPFFSSMANMAKRFEAVGASALVLFNRFYQPDIDLETLEVRPNILLSTPQAQRLPMRWIAILYGHIRTDLAATGGIHTGQDAAKMLLAGATVTMMASALLKFGSGYLQSVEQELRDWMAHHEYESVTQMRGALSQQNAEDPAAYERAQYMKALTYYKAARR